jgi:hypothetical protein
MARAPSHPEPEPARPSAFFVNRDDAASAASRHLPIQSDRSQPGLRHLGRPWTHDELPVRYAAANRRGGQLLNEAADAPARATDRPPRNRDPVSRHAQRRHRPLARPPCRRLGQARGRTSSRHAGSLARCVRVRRRRPHAPRVACGVALKPGPPHATPRHGLPGAGSLVFPAGGEPRGYCLVSGKPCLRVQMGIRRRGARDCECPRVSSQPNGSLGHCFWPNRSAPPCRRASATRPAHKRRLIGSQVCQQDGAVACVGELAL